MTRKLTVVICTHSPRPDHIDRTLAALQGQTLPLDEWDFLIVDNASDPPLVERFDLSWHPHARIATEAELGILPCRIRGLKEAKTPLILFVDDDNLLAPDYLEQALAISESHPFLGAWGGSIIPEFEIKPPPWLAQFRHLLACEEVLEDRWSNQLMTFPPTAGMCLRRPVADAFIQLVEQDPRRQAIGRRGKTGLTNGEDTDLALAACDIGYGIGKFARLKMTHLIPAGRLQEDYLLRLAEGTECSKHVLRALWGKPPTAKVNPPLREWLGKVRRRIFWKRRKRVMFEGKMRAHQKACEVVAGWEAAEHHPVSLAKIDHGIDQRAN